MIESYGKLPSDIGQSFLKLKIRKFPKRKIISNRMIQEAHPLSQKQNDIIRTGTKAQKQDSLALGNLDQQFKGLLISKEKDQSSQINPIDIEQLSVSQDLCKNVQQKRKKQKKKHYKIQKNIKLEISENSILRRRNNSFQ